MEFTAKVNLLDNPQGKMIAFATVIVDGILSLDGFKIFNSANGPFVSPPSERSRNADENGKFKYFDKIRFLEDRPEGSWAGPMRAKLNAAVLAEYNSKAGGGGNSAYQQTGQQQPQQQSGGRPPQGPTRW